MSKGAGVKMFRFRASISRSLSASKTVATARMSCSAGLTGSLARKTVLPVASSITRRFSSSSSSSLTMNATQSSRTDKETALPGFESGERYIGMTGGEIIHELLRMHNVDVIFGYPGGAILPLYDAIYESPHFQFVLPRHEQGGGHMSQGYARVTGKPGVCVVTSGPGATNMVTPLQDALMDGTPMVVFTGQVPTVAMGTDAFQEADVVGITRPCTKWSITVRDVADIPRIVHEAFYVATSGRPGPVLVDLPKDVTASTLTELPQVTPALIERISKKEAREQTYVNDPEVFDQVAELVNSARRPIIYAGQGVIQSEKGVEMLKKFAETANIPVTTTLQGLGGFDEHSDLSLHMLGMHGAAYANLAVQSADLILALGARFDDRVTGNLAHFAPKTRAKEGGLGIVHFEISPKQVNKVVHVDKVVLGDVGENLEKLVDKVRYEPRAEWHGYCNTWKKKYPFSHREAAVNGALMPQRVIAELYEQTKDRLDELVVTTGVGQHQMWAAQFIRWRHPRRWVSSGGAGTMGFGMPSAIGAKLGAPDKIVVDIDGDASYSMTCQELLTAAEYNIGIKVLILNNNFQGMVKQWQDLFYEGRQCQTKMCNPRFDVLADAMGCKGMYCDNEADLPRVMQEFLDYDGPVVLEALVEKEEHVFPMVAAGKALDDMVLGMD